MEVNRDLTGISKAFIATGIKELASGTNEVIIGFYIL